MLFKYISNILENDQIKLRSSKSLSDVNYALTLNYFKMPM